MIVYDRYIFIIMCSNINTLNTKHKFIYIYFIVSAIYMIEYDYICLQQFLIDLYTIFYGLKKKYIHLNSEKNQQINFKNITTVLVLSLQTFWFQFCGS